MRTAKLIILFALLFGIVKAQQPGTGTLPTDDFYEHLVLPHTDAAAPTGYGLTPAEPIRVGIYEETMSDDAKMKKRLNRFLKSYLWADGSRLVFIDRKSKMINNINYDLFRATKLGTKDTLVLYTDMYKTGPLFAPKGFKFYSKQDMATELAPVLEGVQKYNAMADKYADTAAKKASFELVSFFQSNIGLDYLMDQTTLAPVLNDTGIDLDLRAFLIRQYIFHKFEYELTGHTDPLKDAFNTMVDDYLDVTSKHQIFAKGSLATTMVKK